MASQARGERRSGPFTLPSIATMTQGLPQDKSPKHQHGQDMMRDSGMWSMQSPSKHSSTVSSATGFSGASSGNGIHLQSILNSEDSPHRFSSASAASVGSPSRLSSQQNYGHLSQSRDSNYDPRASIDANNTFFIDSRRSSIDSRVGVNIGGLALNNNNQPQSPYDSNRESHSASQASLPSSLHQHQSPSGHHIQPKSNGSSSQVGRRPATSSGQPQPPRRAPPITSNPRSGAPNPNASTPTKGFAWAFPEEDLEKDDDDSFSQNSRQASLASSNVNTIDSSVPPIPHKTITNLQFSEQAALSAGNYSRTPELRVSHKLAERKRRSEMKDLFENLNRILPNSPGNKSSKWEVLSKAVEFIANLKDAYNVSQAENQKLRDQLERAHSAVEENQKLHHEITAMYQQLCRIDPQGHHIFGPVTNQFESKDSQPPTRGGGTPGYAPMQGIEYGQYERR